MNVFEVAIACGAKRPGVVVMTVRVGLWCDDAMWEFLGIPWVVGMRAPDLGV